MLCLSLPASAEAKVPRVFFGAEADPVSAPMLAGDFARMRSAKLGTLRVAFNWAKVEPTQGTLATGPSTTTSSPRPRVPA